MRRSSDRLSDIVERLAGTGSEGISLADVLAAVGERSFGALLVLFALPNVFAGILPGLSIVLGLPLMLLSLQLLVAARKPWLPARLARLQVRTMELRRLAEALVPRLRVLERGLKPRLLLMTAPWAERLIGAACLALATLVFLPIPFANLLPAAGIMLFGSALLERDGLVAIAAVAVTAVSLALFGGVAFAFGAAAGHAFRQLSLLGG